MIIDDFAFRSSLALVRGFVLIACAVAAADAAALLLVARGIFLALRIIT